MKQYMKMLLIHRLIVSTRDEEKSGLHIWFLWLVGLSKSIHTTICMWMDHGYNSLIFIGVYDCQYISWLHILLQVLSQCHVFVVGSVFGFFENHAISIAGNFCEGRTLVKMLAIFLFYQRLVMYQWFHYTTHLAYKWPGKYESLKRLADIWWCLKIRVCRNWYHNTNGGNVRCAVCGMSY